MSMEKKNYIFIVLLLSLFSFQMAAQTYYVNASHQNASDNNPGTSADAPWATLNPNKWTGGTINIAAGTYFIFEEIIILDNTTIVGSSKDEVIITTMDDEEFFEEDRQGNLPYTDKFFTAIDEVNLTVKNLTVKNMRYGDGENTFIGGVFNTGVGSVLTVERVNIKNAIVPAGANAVVNAQGEVILTDVLIEDCELGNTGDSNNAIVCAYSPTTSKMTLEKVRILNCNSSGGSIVNVRQGGNGNSELRVNNCTFENNTYANWGGCVRGVCQTEGKLTFHVTNSFYMHNQGGGTGCNFIQSDGAEARKEFDVFFSNNTFVENYKNGGHSVVYASNDDGQAWIVGTVTFVNNTMVNNSSNETGKDGTAFLIVQTPNATFNFINNIAMTDTGEAMVMFALGGDRATDVTGIGTITGNVVERVGGGHNLMSAILIDASDGNYLAPVDGEDRLPLSEVIKFGDVVRPANDDAPYLPVLEGSYNIDKGTAHTLAPTLDVRGVGAYGDSKDAGAYEWNGTSSIDPIRSDKINIIAYPNPFVSVINFSQNLSFVEIFNMNGICVYKQNNVNSVEVSGLDRGVYIVRATALDGGTSVIRMIK